MIALIDADIVAYRCSAACENEKLAVAQKRTNGMLFDILMGVDHDDCFYDNWKLHLTGSGNFRNDVAVTAPYKGNRADKQKPKHLEGVRQHLVDSWDAVMNNGQEADDAITIDATANEGNTIICSLDKDFMQKSGWHYNFIKKEHRFVSEEEGVRFFYSQILMGDVADNIKGLSKVGPVKANKMLAECTTEKEMYDVCVNAYSDEDRVIENARLLWLRRYENQMWEPPK